MDRSPPRPSGISGTSLPVAAPNHKAINPHSPSPVSHPILPMACDSSTAVGLGCVPQTGGGAPGARWGGGVFVWLKLCQDLCAPNAGVAAGVRELRRRTLHA